MTDSEDDISGTAEGEHVGGDAIEAKTDRDCGAIGINAAHGADGIAAKPPLMPDPIGESATASSPGADPKADADRGPAASEDSGARVDGFTAALRIGMIAVLAAAVGALGLSQSGVLPDVGASSILKSLSRGRGPDLGGFPLLPGDVALSSESMMVNGAVIDSIRCTSALPPKALVGEYAASLTEKGWVYDYRAFRNGEFKSAGSPVPFDAPGHSMLGFRSPNGDFAGIVAFENITRGGSDYFVMRESGSGRPAASGEHVQGREPPGVPMPENSTREYCIERRGDSPSLMVLYASNSPPPVALARMRARMEEEGWSEPGEAREALAAAGEKGPVLFARGTEQVLLSVAPADFGPGSWITVVYRRSLAASK